jgi:hypothetical protein
MDFRALPLFNDFDGYFLSYKLKVPSLRCFYIALEEATGKKGSDIIYIETRKRNRGCTEAWLNGVF